jgi:hypothetical protein
MPYSCDKRSAGICVVLGPKTSAAYFSEYASGFSSLRPRICRHLPSLATKDDSDRLLARIIHECRREAAETEACRGFSQGAMNKWRHVCARRRDGEPAVSWYRDPLRSVEETEREKPRQASGSAAVAGIHELSWLDPPCPLKEVDSV